MSLEIIKVLMQQNCSKYANLREGGSIYVENI